MKTSLFKFALVIFAGCLSFSLIARKKEKFKRDYVFVPSGTFEYQEKAISVQAFYMQSTEVTNKQYRLFLQDLKKQGKEKDYQMALPDTAKWYSFGALNRPMVDLYFNHPAYDNYPVVNVTQAGANLYCIWLTHKMRAKYPKLNFNDFRLPTKLEWIYAAKGGLKKSVYPWGGPYLRNSKGDLLANFSVVGDQNITVDEQGNLTVVDSLQFMPDLEAINQFSFLVSVNAYNPNGYGLYNMAGNAAELVKDEAIAMGGSWRSTGFNIQVTSEEKAEDAQPTFGFRVVSSYTNTN
ncbi:MAG: formylglycine-generating enzyme family protein [Putridiphycobacter sp.]